MLLGGIWWRREHTLSMLDGQPQSAEHKTQRGNEMKRKRMQHDKLDVCFCRPIGVLLYMIYLTAPAPLRHVYA